MTNRAAAAIRRDRYSQNRRRDNGHLCRRLPPFSARTNVIVLAQNGQTDSLIRGSLTLTSPTRLPTIMPSTIAGPKIPICTSSRRRCRPPRTVRGSGAGMPSHRADHPGDACFSPENPSTWNELAELYEAHGQKDASSHAHLKAEAVRNAAAKEAPVPVEAGSKQ